MHPQPPRWADTLLHRFCAPDLHEEMQGDLHELYGKWVWEMGEKRARQRYLRSVFGFICRFARKPEKNNFKLPDADMLKNYLTIALRHISRHKVFSVIHISGLSLGLACCMLIVLYTKDEVSFDRFHENKDRIFRVTATMTDEREVHNIGSTNMAVGPGFRKEIPEIETYIRMQNEQYILRRGAETFTQEVVSVDEDFFSVFSLPLLHGNPETVLSELNSVVLTEETAEKYFGTTQAIGKTLELESGGTFEPFVVRGIAKNPPQNSTVKFSMLMPFAYTEQRFPDDAWLGFYINTFVVLRPDADYRTVEPKLDQVFLKYAEKELSKAREEFNYTTNVHFGLQPFLQIHLDTTYGDIRNGLADGSNPIYSYILSGIALFILLIACINFINLTVAHSLKRGREIGIRKVVGGQRTQLIRQFLGESFVLCFIAFTLALGLVMLTLPVFNELANKRLSFSYLLDARLISTYIALFVGTGLIAGFYPALVLSGFNPVQTLYNRHRLVKKNYLTRGLVVLQFTLATVLAIATTVIYFQFNYLTSKDLGYTDENLVHIHLGRGGNRPVIELLKNELAGEPAIAAIATKDPGQNYTGVNVNGREIFFAFSRIDEKYLPTLQIPLAQGRNFSADFPADAEHSILINETFARQAGWTEPVGKTVFNVNANNREMTVVGVVKDYHYASLKEKIGPQLFIMGGGDLWVKLNPENIPRGLAVLEQAYRKHVPFRPYEYEFMNTINERNYAAEAKWKQIITIGAVLTVFISCIGLLGLAIQLTQQRVKEIGIRKVFGASAGQIVSLLSRDFVTLVLLAFLIASPLAWYASKRWLENFAYQIDISWEIFTIVGIGILLTALLTVSFQAIKAALVNPANSLRNE